METLFELSPPKMVGKSRKSDVNVSIRSVKVLDCASFHLAREAVQFAVGEFRPLVAKRLSAKCASCTTLCVVDIHSILCF